MLYAILSLCCVQFVSLCYVQFLACVMCSLLACVMCSSSATNLLASLATWLASLASITHRGGVEMYPGTFRGHPTLSPGGCVSNFLIVFLETGGRGRGG